MSVRIKKIYLVMRILGVISLETFKAMLDGVLSNLIYIKVSLPMAVGLELIDL